MEELAWRPNCALSKATRRVQCKSANFSVGLSFGVRFRHPRSLDCLLQQHLASSHRALSHRRARNTTSLLYLREVRAPTIDDNAAATLLFGRRRRRRRGCLRRVLPIGRFCIASCSDIFHTYKRASIEQFLSNTFRLRQCCCKSFLSIPLSIRRRTIEPRH